jgi:hypothetical protein
MKISKKYLEVLAIALLYLSALYVWTLPIHNNRLPFGDVDASSHFVVGDYISMNDKSTADVPYYVAMRYGGQNEMFPGKLWYPPQYWTSTGIMQVIGGERITPFFIIIAIFSSLYIVACYFLIRSLFGFLAGFLSSFLLIFSVRDYMVYLFGQWPQGLSFAFTPLVLYCYYKYASSVLANEKREIYAYIMALLLVVQNLMHPQGFMASSATIIIFTGLLFAKEKKLPFNFKDVAVSIAIFFGLSLAAAPLNMGEFFTEIYKTGAGEESSGWDLGILFSWYQDSSKYLGLPDFYFHYNTSHGDINGSKLGYWTLPLLLIGLAALLLKRDRKSILLLSWLAAFYIMTHLSAFGMGSRDQRMMAFEAHVIYPIIVIGLLAIPSFFSIRQRARAVLKALLIGAFVVFALAVNGSSAVKTLASQQYSITRINPYQYEAAEWIMGNLPKDAYIYDIGTFGYQYYGSKIKWLSVLSQRPFVVNDPEINISNYVMIDYSDFALLRNQDSINKLQEYEAKNFNNSVPVYNKKFIRVYKIA